MEREKRMKNFVIVALVVAVVGLSVGFAATLTTVLRITGTVKMTEATWDVKFTSATAKAASTITAEEGPTVTNGNLITYTITLEENKFFEFDAVVNNGGTYNAKVKSLVLSGAEGYEDLVTYTVTGLSENDVINAGSNATMTVKVAMGAITEDTVGLLGENKELTFSVVAEFVPAE